VREMALLGDTSGIEPESTVFYSMDSVSEVMYEYLVRIRIGIHSY
jgi:hypothetical protein